MTKKTRNTLNSNPNLGHQTPELWAALQAALPSLMAVPAETIERPVVDHWRMAGDALRWTARARTEKSRDEALLDRVELFAMALQSAHLADRFNPPPARLDPELAMFADMHLCRLEQVARQLVENGKLAFAELPVAPESSVRGRCVRGLALVELFRARGIKTGLDLEKTVEDTKKMHRWGEETAMQLEVTELRDRAYTAFRAAFDRAMSTETISGVYPVGGLAAEDAVEVTRSARSK